MKLIYTSKLQIKIKRFFHSEECKEANLLTKEDVETFLLDALKAEPQMLIDTLVDKIILFDDIIEIYYKYTQNNNPDEISQEIRRDFCLPSKRQIAATYRHIIFTQDIKRCNLN